MNRPVFLVEFVCGIGCPGRAVEFFPSGPTRYFIESRVIGRENFAASIAYLPAASFPIERTPHHAQSAVQHNHHWRAKPAE